MDILTGQTFVIAVLEKIYIYIFFFFFLLNVKRTSNKLYAKFQLLNYNHLKTPHKSIRFWRDIWRLINRSPFMGSKSDKSVTVCWVKVEIQVKMFVTLNKFLNVHVNTVTIQMVKYMMDRTISRIVSRVKISRFSFSLSLANWRETFSKSVKSPRILFTFLKITFDWNIWKGNKYNFKIKYYKKKYIKLNKKQLVIFLCLEGEETLGNGPGKNEIKK